MLTEQDKLVLKEIISECIQETLKEFLEIEFMKLRASLLPYISKREQEEIESLYGAPVEEIDETEKVEIEL